MLWKAGIEGHIFDLETLSELFSVGDPLVAPDSPGSYYLGSATLQDANGAIDPNAALALVKRVNGTARAADPSFQPVRLTNKYTAPDGSVTALISGTGTIRVKMKAEAIAVRSDGTPVPQPPRVPRGPRYVKLADQDPNVADALRVLGQPEQLDWYDVYKVLEIVEDAVGGESEVAKRGWAASGAIKRLTASANHPGISGDEARHARMKNTPGAKSSMTLSEADGLVRRLVAHWIESHPLY
jgi:hypothetical protein